MTRNKPFCEWTDEMSVGSMELDNQHKHMVEIMNEVYNAFIRGDHREVIGPILDKLSQYVVYHFAMEEVYFELFDFCDKETHIAEHNRFRQVIVDFYNEYKAYNANLTIEILNFLKDWFNDHVLGSDRKYIDCLARNGVK